jgi:hypothetical protein
MSILKELAACAATRMTRTRKVLICTGVFLIIVVWFFRAPLREQIRESATLANDAPTPEVVSEMIEQAADPHAALLRAWNSGKIVQREVAIASLPRLFPSGQPLPHDIESTLLAAAFDPDMNVRETALGILGSVLIWNEDFAKFPMFMRSGLGCFRIGQN